MAKVARKPPKPSADAAPSASKAKMKKKKQHKVAHNPKHRSTQKTQCCCHCQCARKVTRKEKQSLRRTTKRNASMKIIRTRIPKGPRETASLELIHEQTGENDDNLNAPEPGQLGYDPSRICVEDLTSSYPQSTDEDLRNTNA